MRTVSRSDIASLCDRIAKDCRPTKIILFGSYAWGTPTSDSDVDLLVVLPFSGSPVRKALEIDQRLEHPFPIDFLVRTPEFVEQRLAMNDFFYRDIIEKGQVLYDAARARVA
ncbi:MAG: nucleotidyltransferase domain-containing protein [Planctomycetes bacterium]|nr:nucleotidyltransferase domain-containing protein [Planctomycetota bacterium]